MKKQSFNRAEFAFEALENRTLDFIKTTVSMAICTIAGTANAGVVYNWVEIAPSSTISVVSARIEFSQSSWASGSVDYYNSGQPCSDAYPLYCSPDPQAQVLSFQYTFQIQERPSVWDTVSGRFPSGGANRFRFTFGPTVSGDINYTDGPALQTMAMSGSDIWTVTQYSNDMTDCNWLGGDGCTGASGRWVLDPTTIVPAPSSLILLTTAFLGMAVRSKKRFR